MNILAPLKSIFPSNGFRFLATALFLVASFAASQAAIITVNSTNDPAGFNPNITVGSLGGTITLRDAVNAANNTAGTDLIAFDPALDGKTINLTQVGDNANGATALAITSVVAMAASPGMAVTVSRGSAAANLRLFTVPAGGSLLLTNLTIANAMMLNNGEYGGAIRNSGDLIVDHCTLRDNWAGQNATILNTGGGGGIYNGGTAVVADSTIKNCLATMGGGGIWNTGTMAIVRSTLAGNSMAWLDFSRGGGGLFIGAGTVNLTNCTLTANSTFWHGGAAHVLNGTLNLHNCTVAGNVNGNSPGIRVSSGTFTARNCIIQSVGGFGFPPANANLDASSAGLGTFGNNGGPTETFALLPNAPALGAGVPTAAVTTDQRGVARHAFPDIGAYEMSPRGTLMVTTTVDEDNGSTDSDSGTGTSLREALHFAASLGSPRTITFSPALTASNPVTITLSQTGYESFGPSALLITNDVTIQGPANAPGVTLAASGGAGGLRHFFVETSGNLTLANLTLTGGTSTNRGGSVTCWGKLKVAGCTFTGNSSTFEGGAVHCLAGALALAVENSTFAGNSATIIGGAIVTGAYTNALTHVTIVDNASANGAYWQFQTPVTMRNSIIARNFDGSTPSDIVTTSPGGFTADSSNNLIGPGGAANLTNGINANFVGVAATNLLLGTLTNNGGPTLTIAPLAGSPVINSGISLAGLTTDQRGFARTVSSAPDLGALEDAIGNSDPDGDNLSNVQELALGTNPVALDSDGDGFNDATEILNGTAPNSSASVPAPNHIERVLGVGPARGLDLAGRFAYAFNVGTPGDAREIGEAYFSADNLPTIALSAPQDNAHWNNPDFGTSADDEALEFVYQSIRWADANDADTSLRQLKLDLKVVAGRHYKLQLLFGEGGTTNRAFDIFVEGALVLNDFNPATAQGSVPVTKAASAFVYEFIATDDTLNIVLDGSATPPGSAPDPFLNGATLEDLSPLGGTPVVIQNATQFPDGSFGFSFTNTPGASFSVRGSEEVDRPFMYWWTLSAPIETPTGSGHYQFVDPEATNYYQFYYTVTSP